MLKLGEVSATLMGRHISGHKVHHVEIKFFYCGTRNGQVAQMYRIESTAQKSQSHALPPATFIGFFSS
jgi:hypothetical protein